MNPDPKTLKSNTHLPCPVCQHSTTNKNATLLAGPRESNLYHDTHKARCLKCKLQTTVHSIEGKQFFYTRQELIQHHENNREQ